jgi:hypothetical protein
MADAKLGARFEYKYYGTTTRTMGHFWINNVQIPIVIMSIAAGQRFMERLPKAFPPEVQEACMFKMQELHLPEFIESKEKDTARIDEDLKRLAVTLMKAFRPVIVILAGTVNIPVHIPTGVELN